MGFPLWMQTMLGSVVRWAFTVYIAAFFIGKGVWTGEQASQYAGYIALASLSLLWSLWQKRDSLKRYFTALALPAGTTDAQARSLIGQGGGVKATMAQHESPFIEPVAVEVKPTE